MAKSVAVVITLAIVPLKQAEIPLNTHIPYSRTHACTAALLLILPIP